MTNDNILYKYTKKDDNYLKYYNPIDIGFDDSDYLITITDEYNNHPKKLALELYGYTELSWIFSYFNRDKIQDPIFDLKAGMKILVPTKERLLKYF